MPVTKAQPNISVVGDEVVIRVPRFYFGQNGQSASEVQKVVGKKEPDFKSFPRLLLSSTLFFLLLSNHFQKFHKLVLSIRPAVLF